MTLLRISSYHAALNPCFSEKQPHKMSFYRYFVIICEGNERAGQGGEEKDISRRDCASSGGGSLARREYLFPHPAHFGSRYLSLGREISLFSGRTPLAALLWPGNQPFFRPNTSRSTALAGRTRGLGDGRAEYHKGRRFLALVTVKTYFCLSVYHLNYV